MGLKLKIKTFIVLLIFTYLGTGCDNKREVMDSKKEINQEAKEIEDKKNEYEESIDSLNKEIKLLAKKKQVKKEEFAEAEIYNVVKNSYLDHIIIGSNNLEKSKSFFQDKLGFTIKEGKKHNNGIINFFIEFVDSSEIEIVSITNPIDLLAKEYNTLLKIKHFGFQFALRTNEIQNLKNHFGTLSSNFSHFDENLAYSTLAQKEFKQELPIFFIQHHQKHFNTKTNHSNNSNGISAIWLSTIDIKKSAQKYIDFGFSIMDTISLGDIKKKTVLLRNDNFEIILIGNDKYEISGLTLSISNLDIIQKIVKDNLNLTPQVKNNKRGKSISLDPTTTNSIWFEFLEKAN